MHFSVLLVGMALAQAPAPMAEPMVDPSLTQAQLKAQKAAFEVGRKEKLANLNKDRRRKEEEARKLDVLAKQLERETPGKVNPQAMALRSKAAKIRQGAKDDYRAGLVPPPPAQKQEVKPEQTKPEVQTPVDPDRVATIPTEEDIYDICFRRRVWVQPHVAPVAPVAPAAPKGVAVQVGSPPVVAVQVPPAGQHGYISAPQYGIPHYNPNDVKGPYYGLATAPGRRGNAPMYVIPKFNPNDVKKPLYGFNNGNPWTQYQRWSRAFRW